MFEIWANMFGTAILVLLGLWAVLKLLLPKFMDIAIKRIEHTQNQELKHLESRLEIQSSALMNSLHVASHIGDSFRKKTIESIDDLWKELLRIRQEFSPLVALESILTEAEFISATSSRNSTNEEIQIILNEYSSFPEVMGKIAPKREAKNPSTKITLGVGTETSELHKTKIYVSEKLWKIYSALISVHGRLGYLVSKGIESGSAASWRSDQHMESIVLDILSKETLEQVKRMKFSGLKALIDLLEQQFIIEARKNIRGFDELAESFSEVNQITQEEEAKARYGRDYL